MRSASGRIHLHKQIQGLCSSIGESGNQVPSDLVAKQEEQHANTIKLLLQQGGFKPQNNGRLEKEDSLCPKIN